LRLPVAHFWGQKPDWTGPLNTNLSNPTAEKRNQQVNLSISKEEMSLQGPTKTADEVMNAMAGL
jgi:hypothetical protein